MMAFLPCRFPFPTFASIPSHSKIATIRATHPKRRRPLQHVICQQAQNDDVMLNDFVSDTTHVVLDAKDIPAVLNLLKDTEDDPDLFFDEFLHRAEEHVDGVRNPSTTVGESSAVSPSSELGSEIADYSHPDLLAYIPSWARDGFEADIATSPNSTMPLPQSRRLHNIAEQPAGIEDCRLSDIADDYSVPIEFIMDAVLALGVEAPISVGDGVKDTLNDKQIKELLRLLSTFDAVDLADRYSDRSVKEMSDDYDLDLNVVMITCENEGFHMCSGSATRLSVVQEDRLLDILLKMEPMGRPYPSALEGLI